MCGFMQWIRSDVADLPRDALRSGRQFSVMGLCFPTLHFVKDGAPIVERIDVVLFLAQANF
jgi:hypothetical protein